ncbi:hypothetical protein GOP47_0006868 [Adiantum capillus-veneris]|uniref:Protein kinase domain-containing protein n=1 Tax=Adiantum capillus-veneris TaxID=13818 RepID=A0A9D4V593_ADICA|nr:hypothetical protein GOP47_0006868 [Adiantum capillus-veneris]
MADVLLQEVAQALTQFSETLRSLLRDPHMSQQYLATDQARAAAVRLLLLQWRSRDAFQDFGEFYCIRLILDEQSALASYFIGLFSELDRLLAGYLRWLCSSTPLGLQVRRISATCRLLYAASRMVPRQDVGNNSEEFKRAGKIGRMFSSNELHCKMRQVGLVNLDQQGVSRVSLCKEPLGTGASAAVYKGVFEGFHIVDTNQQKIIGDPMAVKMFSNYCTDESVTFGARLRQSTGELPHLLASNTMLPECIEDARLRAELIKLVSVRHPNIVIAKGYIGDREQQGESGLVMELMDESLHDYLQKVEEKSVLPLDELEMVDLMLEIAKGMQFLHECNLMHRDLKPKNVLLRFSTSDQGAGRNQFEVKLADFGLTKLYSLAQDGVQDRHTYTAKVGTPCNMAPELWAKTLPIYDEKIDIFSYGTTCFNILVGNPDVKAFVDSRDCFDEAVETGQWMQWVQDFDVKLSFIVKLVARCWKTDPNMRPTFATLCILLQDRLWFLLGFETGVSFFSLDNSTELKAWAYALNRQYVQGCKAIFRRLIQRRHVS